MPMQMGFLAKSDASIYAYLDAGEGGRDVKD